MGVDLYVKIEGANPTGSFKDRGMVMAVAKAKEAGSNTVICASTGNTSASAAAYAARAGMRCIIVIPAGKIAMGKVAQAVMYGAEILSIQGNFDDALKMVRNISKKEPVTLVNSVNPYRLEGQKTAAFEVCDQLGEAPDILAIPVGNAGNISAYWKGFKEYNAKKGISCRKCMVLKPKVRPLLFITAFLKILKLLLQQFELAILRAGILQSMLLKNQMGKSMKSVMKKF